MSQITIFNFAGADFRASNDQGEPAFVGSDVAEILGYADPARAIRQHCKGRVIYLPLQTAGGMQEVRFITEPDLYRLVINSKLPAAVEFEKHVMEVILPQIRKTGSYQLPSYPDALRLLATKLEENEHLRLTVEKQAPAVEFVEKYVKAEGLFGIRQTAKVLGLQQNAFVSMCIEKKVLFREGGNLQPFSEWIKAGHFQVKTGEANEHSFTQTRFTSKGIEWVRRRLNVSALLGNSEQKEAA